MTENILVTEIFKFSSRLGYFLLRHKSKIFIVLCKKKKCEQFSWSELSFKAFFVEFYLFKLKTNGFSPNLDIFAQSEVKSSFNLGIDKKKLNFLSMPRKKWTNCHCQNHLESFCSWSISTLIHVFKILLLFMLFSLLLVKNSLNFLFCAKRKIDKLHHLESFIIVLFIEYWTLSKSEKNFWPFILHSQ